MTNADPNAIRGSTPLRGETAYVYAFKARAKNHHCLGYGTFTADFSAVERLRKEYSRAIQPITYLPIFVKATALAVEKNPAANAILFKRLLGVFGYRIVEFERVDVNLPITRRLGSRFVTFIGTIRDAPNKTLGEIQAEISEYQRCAPEESFAIRRIQKFSKMPLWLSRLIHWRMTISPRFYVENVGTCGLTLIEGDWYDNFLPIAPTSLVICPGAVKREPVVRGNAVEIGRVVKVSMMADNYVISGLTGAKVAKDFKELIESGQFVRDEIDRTERTLATVAAAGNQPMAEKGTDSPFSRGGE